MGKLGTLVTVNSLLCPNPLVHYFKPEGYQYFEDVPEIFNMITDL
jgi:hypothetical protein